MKLLNTSTGQFVMVDKKKMRVARMVRRVKSWCNAVQAALDDKDHRLLMVTLTYRGVEDWKANHIREFMLAVKKHAGKRLKGYAWVAEMQERGAVHYHVLMLVHASYFFPMPDKTGMWAHGMSKTEIARSPYYILKYAGKEKQKFCTFPKGLRMFGLYASEEVCSGLSRWFFRISTLPAWMRENLKGEHFGLSFERVIGGGWRIGEDVYKSPWIMVWV
jgi:hypothetical protein